MPHMSGVTRLPTRLSEDKPTLARQLKKAGYTTAVFGKMHFNQPAKPGLHGFDVPLTEQELTRAWNKEVKPRPAPEGVATKPQWRPFKDPSRILVECRQTALSAIRERYAIALSVPPG